MRRLPAIVLGVTVLFLACRCDSGGGGDGGGGGDRCPTCEQGCAHIYETCEKSLTDNTGAQMSQAQCTSVCRQAANGGDFAACVTDVDDCSDSGLLACVQSPPAAQCGGGGDDGGDDGGDAPRQPHGEITGAPVCLECHGEGTNGAPKVPGDHDGRGNDSCLGCHQ